MQLVGVSEIAEMLGVTPGRASQLANESNFPKPLATPKAGRMWKRMTIERWAEVHRPNERTPT